MGKAAAEERDWRTTSEQRGVKMEENPTERGRMRDGIEALNLSHAGLNLLGDAHFFGNVPHVINTLLNTSIRQDTI